MSRQISENSKRGKVALIVLMILAAVQILVFSAEFALHSPVQSLEMAEASFDLSSAIKQNNYSSLMELRAQNGIRSVILYFPLALIYLGFGVSQITTISYSLICSLINLYLLYKITYYLFNQATALVSCFIWSSLPWSILWGGIVSPLVPQLTASLLVIHIILITKYWNFKSVFKLFIFLALLLLFESTLFIAVVIIGFLHFGSNILLSTINRPWPQIRSWNSLSLLLIILLMLFMLSMFSLNVFYKKLPNLLSQTGVSVLWPIILLSLAANLRRRYKRLVPLLVWVVTGSIVGLALGILHSEIETMLWKPIFLFTLFPIVIMFSDYLTANIPVNRVATTLPVLATFTAILHTIVAAGRHELIPTYQNLELISPDYVLIFSGIATGLAIFVYLVYPSFQKKKYEESRFFYLGLFLFLFSLGMIRSTWEGIEPFRDRVRSLRAIADTVQSQILDIQIFFPNSVERNFYIFLSQAMNPRESAQPNQARTIQGDINEIENAYIILEEGNSEIIPEEWWELGRYGLAEGSRYILLRSLVGDSLISEKLFAMKLAMTNENPTSLWRLYGAYVNDGETCKAYALWMRIKLLQAGGPSYIPVNVSSSCIKNLLDSTDSITDELSQFVGSYRVQGADLVLEQIADERFPDGVWRIRQQEERFPDPRTVQLSRNLEKNSFYLYTVWVRSIEPAYVLYWKIEDIENYYSQGRYPSWTQVAILIYSGNDNNSVLLNLSPALTDNYGFVYIYELKFVKYDLN